MQIRLLRKSLLTFVALKRSISRMSSRMPAQIRPLIKGLWTQTATERFDTRVDFNVTMQIGFLRKHFQTVRAFVDVGDGALLLLRRLRLRGCR